MASRFRPERVEKVFGGSGDSDSGMGMGGCRQARLLKV